MNTLWQNLRFGLRLLAKSPGFTLVTVLTLALGIGANTAIFSVVYSALLRPLPYYQPERLITMGEGRLQSKDNDAGSQNSSNPDFLDWQKMAKSFQVKTNFFPTLGVRPLLGRGFLDGEDVPDGPHVAMLTYGYWQSDFGGDPGAIGRTIQLDGKPATIVGVLPRDFQFSPATNPVWVPLHPGPDSERRRSLRWLNVVGRLVPGSELVARSPLQLVGSINAPVLFVHGLDDKVVPPEQSRRMVSALRQNGVRALLVEIEGESHGFRKSTSLVRTLEAELAFYGSVLGFAPAGDLLRAKSDLADAETPAGATWS